MDEIIVRVLQGKADPSEAELLLRWRNAEPENERRYRDLARLWISAPPARPLGSRRPPPSSFEIIREARQRLLPAAEPATPAWRPWVGRAAAALALVAAGFGAGSLREPRPFLAGGVVTTSATEMATVTLSDGSVVRVGTGSEIRFGDHADEREVWLDGSAFFSVASDEDRPFTIRTAAGKAVALGTRLWVRTSEAAMQVGVTEGRVVVATDEVSRELVGGEVGQVADRSLSVRRALGPDELRPRLGNFLAFRSTPLWTVLEEVGAHYGVPVELRDPALGGRTITASFQDDGFEEVLSVICRITASRCTIAATGAAVGEVAVQ